MSDFNKEELLIELKDWYSIIKKYQIPNTQKAVIQLVNSYGFFIAIWVLQFYLYSHSVLWVIGLAVLNGFLLGRIFIIQHDCGHKSFLRNRTANDIIGTISSFFTFIPYKYWAANHNFHHSHNGQIEHSDIGDIECLTVKQYSELSLIKKIKYRIYRHPLYLFTIGGFIYVTVYNRFAFLKEGVFAKIKHTVTWSNIFYAIVYIGLGYVIGFKEFFIVQFINIFFFGTYALWFFYIQHQYESIYKSTQDNWNYVVAAIKGSTFYDLPFFLHWLTGNIGYHHLHHLSPAIPNYNLKACNDENPIFEKYTNKVGFWEGFSCVFANLYDDASGKMISFAEYRRRKNKLTSF